MSQTSLIYFDNAATTMVKPEVLHAMMPYLQDHFGNPSSIHSFGRKTKKDLEGCRRQVATLLDAQPSEIIFNSGGTESMNTALLGLLCSNSSEKILIISTELEHHATLHSISFATTHFQHAEAKFLSVDKQGNIDLQELDQLLQQSVNHYKVIIVSLMAANNEIGTRYDVQSIGAICHQYHAIFICDMVQMIGHYTVSLKELNVDIATSSGHKFHAPKGIGLLYVNADIRCTPYLHGGGQERNMRAGTENITGIVGFAEALRLQMEHLQEDTAYISALKQRMIKGIADIEPRAFALGNTSHSLYSMVNMAFPLNEKTEMLMYKLDMHGVAISSGSACSSGTLNASHVIQKIGLSNIVPIRFSFSALNTSKEVDDTLNILRQILS